MAKNTRNVPYKPKDDIEVFHGKDGRELRLTDKQMRVVELAVTTMMTDSQIAEAVGYAQGDAGRSAVWKTLRKPHVQAYMAEMVKQHMGSKLTLKSMRVIEHLLEYGNSERVRMEAAQDLLDRVGARAPEQRVVSHQGGISINIDLS